MVWYYAVDGVKALFFVGDVFDNTGKVEEIHWRQVSWVQMDAHNPTIEVLFWRKIG